MSTHLVELRDITKKFPGVLANDEVSFILDEGEIVALDGTKSWNADFFLWEQVFLGNEPQVVINNQDEAIGTFAAPELDVGAILTFRLRAHSSTGKDFASTRVAVRANNAPGVSPSNLRVELRSRARARRSM